MSIKPTSFIGAAALLWLSLLAGCATVPTQEMSDARQALQAAREVEAAAHAPANFNEAEARMLRAEKKLSDHDYRSARKNALTARREAISARNMALAISQAKQVFAQAEAEGVSSQVARDLLSRAEAAAQAGDEEAVVSAAGRAKARAMEDLRRAREARERERRE